MGKVVFLLFGLFVSLFGNNQYPSLHDNMFLDVLHENNADTEDLKGIVFYRKILANSYNQFAEYDNNMPYYPNGWKGMRIYIPSGIKIANLSFITKPNADIKVHITFIGSLETSTVLINHNKPKNPGSALWDMNGTTEVIVHNTGRINFDSNIINEKAGGWLYIDIVDDLLNPEYISSPENYGYEQPVFPEILLQLAIQTTTASDINQWIASTLFLEGGGDPSEADTHNILIMNKLESNIVSSNEITDLEMGSQQYVDMDDYIDEPKIGKIAYTGNPVQFEQIEFDTEYNLSGGATLQSVLYDFNGTYGSENTVKYNTPGIKTVLVKVIDDKGRFSIKSRMIDIIAVPYEQMTFEQKIKYLVNPEYLTDIENEISMLIEDTNNSAWSEGNQSGWNEGNRSGYDIGTIKTMEYCNTLPEACGIKKRTVIIPIY